MPALEIALICEIVLPTISFLGWLALRSRKQKTQGLSVREQIRSAVGATTIALIGAALLYFSLIALRKTHFSDEQFFVYMASLFSLFLFIFSSASLL